ncbi:hypothetical protein [Streptomyces carpaticus]|uniref:Uncharacterized protein n=1 Tax=Streptomyces carpaticus TaxID=285558 RepID=A0ABV4ZQA2_9ACTN
MDRLPDTTTALAPTTITPGPLEPAPASEPMVWVPGPGNGFVAVPRSLLPADYFTPPAPTPAPPARGGIAASIDPRAQVIAAGGVFAAGTGWGIGQVLSAFAGLGTAGLAALALAAVVARMPRPGTTTETDNTGGGASTEIHVHRGARVKARNLNIR